MPIQFHLPPPDYWEEFEDILSDLFKAVWKDPHALKHGRSGQPQNGVDVYGQPGQKEKWEGVQAKKKKLLASSSVTEKELVSEVNEAKNFSPKLSNFILATTGQRDQKIQEKARLITEAHQKEGLFRVHVYSWEDIEELLHAHPEVAKRRYPRFFPDEKVVEVNSTLTSFYRDFKSFKASFTIQGAGSQKVYQVVIDQANALIDQFKPKTALVQLEALRRQAWEEADQITKWKILNNIAAAKFQLNEDKEAAQLLIEAAQYNQDDEKALSNLAFAYLLLENFPKAEEYIAAVLQKNAASERAYALKIRIQSLRNEDFDSIVERVPEEFRRLQEIASALGDAAGKCGNLRKCQYWFEITYRGKDASPEIAIIYVTSLFISIAENKLVLRTNTISQSQKTQLETIIAIYTNAYTKIVDSEYLALKTTCLFNRGIAWKILGNYDNAAKDFERMLELEPANDKCVFQRTEVALLSGKKDFALSLLESIKESKVVPAALLLAKIYKENLDYSTSREILKKYLETDHPSEFKERAYHLFIEVLLASGNYDEADKESASLLAANQENVGSLLIRASVLKRLGKDGESQEHLIAAKNLVTVASPFTTIVDLADQYYSLTDYSNAVPFYEMIADISVNNYITRNLLTCHYGLGNERETLQICTILRQIYGALKGITEIEAQIYDGVGNLEIVKEIYEAYLERYPLDLRVQLRLAAINFREQNFDALDKFLKQKHSITDATLEERIHLSDLLSIRGFDDEDLEIMYETRRTFFGQSDAHLQYIAALFRRKKEYDPLLEVEKVTENTAVCVKDSRGVNRWYIIENRQDADISKNELNLTHPLAQKLLGGEAGDKVVLVEHPQKKEGTILEIKIKYVHALHETVSNFETNFSDTKGFNVLHLTLPQNADTEDNVDFSVLFEMVDKRHNHINKVLDLYKSGPLTIGALAKLLGKNPIEAWGMLMNTPDVGIRSTTGEVHEFAEVSRLLASEYPQLVADITSLMTLHHLDIAKDVVNVFGRIVIAQSTLDQFIIAINSRKDVSEKGFMIVGKDGETYIREDITADRIKKSAEYLQAILDWIKKECDIISCEEALQINAGQRQKLYDFFGHDAIDSVLLAKQEKRIFLSEDERLRHLAKNFYSVDSAWTQPLLERILFMGKIDNITYQRLLIKLVLSNYHHTSISEYTIEEAAKQSSWKPDRRFEKVAGVLSGGNSDDSSALNIASNFIYKLYNQKIFLADPSILLFTILDLLFKSRAQRSILLARFINNVRVRFFLLPALQQEIEQLIYSWSRRQTSF